MRLCHLVMQAVIIFRSLISHVLNAIRRQLQRQFSPTIVLDEPGGLWAREEAAGFDIALQEQRSIDSNVWQYSRYAASPQPQRSL